MSAVERFTLFAGAISAALNLVVVAGLAVLLVAVPQ
jgi:hypothetical protein